MSARAPGARSAASDTIAFLFLGEALLIPHLWPIAEALSDAAPDVRIDLWASTAMHERLLRAWLRPGMRLRRAPSFRDTPPGEFAPTLPAKLPMLARLAPHLTRTRVAVCAEQTSLWLPRALPFLPTKFVKTSHGVGSMSARDDKRRRAAWRMLVPSAAERATYLARGFAPERVVATGYVKAAFAHRTHASPFANGRPTLLYTPHWQRHRSSWWDWGAALVERLAAQTRWNVILQPHQRLAERAPEVRDVLARVAHLRHIHVDLDGFACVDGSYTAAADLYLGDTSSQVVEFAARPRPCVFLNPQRAAWRDDPSYAMWAMGDVVEQLDDVLAAIDAAPAHHARYAQVQRVYAAAALGDASGVGAANAAREVLAALAASR